MLVDFRWFAPPHLFVKALRTPLRLLATWCFPSTSAPIAHIVVFKVSNLKGAAVDHGEGIVEMGDLVCRDVGGHELIGLRPPLEPIGKVGHKNLSTIATGR